MNILLIIIGSLITTFSILVTITEIEEWEIPIKGILIFFIGLGIVCIGCKFKVGKEGSDTIDIYMKVLALIVNSYQEKLKQIIKLIDDEKGKEN